MLKLFKLHYEINIEFSKEDCVCLTFYTLGRLAEKLSYSWYSLVTLMFARIYAYYIFIEERVLLLS